MMRVSCCITYTFTRPKGNHTLLNDLRPGMKLHGGVVGVTEFGAFLDVHVVRKSSGGRLVRCNALLHPQDVPEGHSVLRDGRPIPPEADAHIIRRGSHVPVSESVMALLSAQH